MPKAYLPKLILSAKADKPHEILVHGPIGGSFWSDEGITGKEFTDALNKIPAGEKVIVGVNSQGGAVGEGLAIYNAIARRSADITVRIDGYALSAASFLPLAASKVISPKSAIWMMHNGWSYTQGNAEDHRKSADMLDKHDGVIVGIYSEKTGKSDNEIKKAMAAETWMSGAEAIEWGLADEESDNKPALDALDFAAATPQILAAICNALVKFEPDSSRPSFHGVFAAPKPISAPQQGADNRPLTQPIIMKKEQILALLKKHGIKVPDNATDEQLMALVDTIPAASATPPPPATPPPANDTAGAAALLNRITSIEAAYAAERKKGITARVDALIASCQVTSAERDKAIARATADDSYLDELSARPVIPAGADPVDNAMAVTVSDDPRAIDKAVTDLWCKGPQDRDSMVARANKRAAIIMGNLKRILSVWNATNTISADLKRTVILQQMIRAFAVRVLPLRAFATVFNGIKLEGTDKVVVPYYALDATASTDFVAANGYDTFGNTAHDVKTVTIDKRKYQGLAWTSVELARQPYLDVGMAAMLKAEQLAIDVITDILSLVTAANYGAAAHTGAGNAFDSEDVADLKGVADLANWPVSGRSLVVNSAYDVNLLKDQAIKGAMNFGDSDPIQEGRILRLVGFDYYPDGRVPNNGENLEGFIAWKSALLVAFSPVTPTPEVRDQLTRYEVVTEPTTGITFEYRRWGNPDMDQTREIIEVNYGKGVGEAAALKRIVSA